MQDEDVVAAACICGKARTVAVNKDATEAHVLFPSIYMDHLLFPFPAVYVFFTAACITVLMAAVDERVLQAFLERQCPASAWLSLIGTGLHVYRTRETHIQSSRSCF